MLLRVRVIKDQTHQKPAPPQSSVGHWSGVTSWDLFCHNFKIDGSKENHQNWRRLSKSTIHLHNILCPTLRYWFRLGQFPVLIQSKFIPTDWFLKFALQIKNLYKKTIQRIVSLFLQHRISNQSYTRLNQSKHCRVATVIWLDLNSVYAWWSESNDIIIKLPDTK